MGSAEEVMSPVTLWSCCSELDWSSEHTPGWRSAGGLLCAPRPPASSGSLPLWAAASPAWKTSRSLCLGARLCSCCSALQVGQPRGKKQYVKQRHSFILRQLRAFVFLKNSEICPYGQLSWDRNDEELRESKHMIQNIKEKLAELELNNWHKKLTFNLALQSADLLL